MAENNILFSTDYESAEQVLEDHVERLRASIAQNQTLNDQLQSRIDRNNIEIERISEKLKEVEGTITFLRTHAYLREGVEQGRITPDGARHSLGLKPISEGGFARGGYVRAADARHVETVCFTSSGDSPPDK